jgi:hypothetical protein
VDPVPDPLLLRKSGSAGNRTQDLCVSYIFSMSSMRTTCLESYRDPLASHVHIVSHTVTRRRSFLTRPKNPQGKTNVILIQCGGGGGVGGEIAYSYQIAGLSATDPTPSWRSAIAATSTGQRQGCRAVLSRCNVCGKKLTSLCIFPACLPAATFAPKSK